MRKTKSKSIKILPNMQIYKRSESPRWYGCLRLNGRYYRKCLNTENRNDAEKNLFNWKSELLTSPNSLVGDSGNSFSAYAKRLIQKEKQLPPRPSGIEQWTDTQRLLKRTNGLLDFFGNRDVNKITLQDVEDFFQQLPHNNLS